MSSQEDFEAAAWRIIRAAYLRVACHFTAQKPERLTDNAQADLLDRWSKPMAHDIKLLGEVLRQARLAGVSSVHERLHDAPGVDHEMLDQAVEYAQAEGEESA